MGAQGIGGAEIGGPEVGLCRTTEPFPQCLNTLLTYICNCRCRPRRPSRSRHLKSKLSENGQKVRDPAQCGLQQPLVRVA